MTATIMASITIVKIINLITRITTVAHTMVKTRWYWGVEDEGDAMIAKRIKCRAANYWRCTHNYVCATIHLSWWRDVYNSTFVCRRITEIPALLFHIDTIINIPGKARTKAANRSKHHHHINIHVMVNDIHILWGIRWHHLLQRSIQHHTPSSSSSSSQWILMKRIISFNHWGRKTTSRAWITKYRHG